MNRFINKREKTVFDLMIGGDAVRRKMDTSLEIEVERSPTPGRVRERGRLARAFAAVPRFGITSFGLRGRDRSSAQRPCSETAGH
jgi:hypothetical protein